MVGPFNPGVVRIDFQSDVQSVQRGFTQVEAGLNQVGTTVQKTASATVQANDRMQKSVAVTGKTMATFANRVGNAGIRLLSLQLILQQFGTRAGVGKFGKEVRAAADSLTVFVSAISIAPGPIGIAIGVIGALTVAFIQLSGASEAAQKATERVNQAVISSEEALRNLNKAQFDALFAQNRRNDIVDEFDLKEGIQDEIKLRSALESQVGAIQKIIAIRKVQAAITFKLGQEERTISGANKKILDDRIKELDKEAASIGRGFFKLQNRIAAENERAAAISKASTNQLEFAGAVAATAASLARIDEAFKAGLITPLEVATKRAEVFEAQIKASAKAATEFAKTQKFLQERFPLEKTAGDPATQRATALAEKRAIERPKELSEEFARDFSEPLGQAIGQATFEGVLQGAEAMEILGNIGENIFANFLSQSVETFQKQMISAFDAIAGQGGAVLGQALTAAVGIAGFFLSKQGRGESSAAFAGVQSAIDSSQAVRGVVSGPTSVAIAAVGEDLRRAMEPVRELMAMSLVELRKITANTSSGPGGGGGGQSLAGSVPTT